METETQVLTCALKQAREMHPGGLQKWIYRFCLQTDWFLMPTPRPRHLLLQLQEIPV